ncbi:ankyrin repeat domain-containing protein [Leptospira sp. 96542]|nr:ankyrin repeat domain-containing protein [Leptospira sp. 96542]
MLGLVKNWFRRIQYYQKIRRLSDSICSGQRIKFIKELNDLAHDVRLTKESPLLLGLAIDETTDRFFLESLLNLGMDPNMSDEKGVYPLHRATESGRWDAVDLLLKAGASPNVTDPQGVTALHIANSYDGLGYISDLLIANGANIYQRDNLGKRYLM